MIRQFVDWWIGARGYGISEGDAGSHQPAVIVTGGSAGIGRALAEAFASGGNRVVLIARDSTKLTSIAEQLKAETGADIRTLSLDIAADDAIDRLMVWLDEQGLYCDILVNNAGVGASGGFAEESAEHLRTLVELNVAALTDLCRHAIPEMKARRRGGVLNVASMGGLTPGPYQAAYYASKAYVISLSEALAWELRGTGVRVTCLAPGPVETEFHEKMNAESALYRYLVPGASPGRVARAGVRAFWWGQTLIVPGLLNKLMGLAVRVAPLKWSSAVMGLLLKPRRA